MNRDEGLSLLRGEGGGVPEWNRRRSKGETIPDLEKADLTKAQLERVRLESVQLKPDEEPQIVNLQGAILAEARLQKADLSRSFLRGANLHKANLNAATLEKTNLTEAVLTGADFQGATLAGAILLRAKVAGANFRDSDLQDADLREMEGFYSDQLAGASVSGTKLPEEIKSFAALKTIEKACNNARTIFLVMLLGCAYTVLTIGTTTDARLITNSSSSPLPIIGTRIPIVGFYVTAPLILLGFYLYFHLCMQNVWERLGSLPAILPDGRHLNKAADPWLMVGLVESHFTRLREGRTFLSHVQAVVSFLLAWCTVPLTLFLLWGRYLRVHDWIWSAEQILVLGGSVAITIYTYRSAVFGLTGVPQPRLSFEHTRQTIRCEGILITLGVFLFCSIITYASIQGGIFDAYVENADVSVKPEGWTGDPSKEKDEILQVKPAALAAANLRNVRGHGAFLVRADLRGADLRGADLSEADLRGADLSAANLFMADLRQTALSGEQASSACIDEATKLPEIKGFVRDNYTPSASCNRLWGSGR